MACNCRWGLNGVARNLLGTRNADGLHFVNVDREPEELQNADARALPVSGETRLTTAPTRHGS